MTIILRRFVQTIVCSGCSLRLSLLLFLQLSLLPEQVCPKFNCKNKEGMCVCFLMVFAYVSLVLFGAVSSC